MTTTTTISERFLIRRIGSDRYMQRDKSSKHIQYYWEEEEFATIFRSKEKADAVALHYMETANFSGREIEVVHSRIRTEVTTITTVEIEPTVVSTYDVSLIPAD